MQVLVTGVTGFIGRHLVKRLLADERVEKVYGVSRTPWKDPCPAVRGGKYYRVCCDLTDSFQVTNILAGRGPDVIYHLAANPIVRENQDDPTGISRTNILATHNLLAYAPKGCRFILASSATVYGDAGKQTICFESTPSWATSIYGATKIASEALVQSYTHLGQVKGVWPRLVANVGPESTHGVVHDFIRKLRSPDPQLEVLGAEPGATKPYLHVKDTVEALVTLLDHHITGPVNISADDEITVADVVDAVMQGLGIYKHIKWLGEAANWRGDQARVCVDNCLMKSFDWRPSHNSSWEAVFAAAREVADQCQPIAA